MYIFHGKYSNCFTQFYWHCLRHSFRVSIFFQYWSTVFIAWTISCYHRSLGLLWKAHSAPGVHYHIDAGPSITILMLGPRMHCYDDMTYFLPKQLKESISVGQGWGHWCSNTLAYEWNGCHLVNTIFKGVFEKEKCCTLIHIDDISAVNLK